LKKLTQELTKNAMQLGHPSYADIIDNLHDGLYFVDRNRRITYWNKAAEQMSGFSAAEVVGKSCADNILTHVDSEGRSLCRGLCPLAQSIKDGQPREAEVYMHHKDGHRIPVSVRTSVLKDDLGTIIGGVELFTDISNHRASELRLKELEKMAMLDGLTQLANRNFIEQELESRLQEHKRYDVPFGVLFIDIDHFKKFNDTYGHDIGDHVLKFVAQTFIQSSRPFDLYGRWGGEEFIGIIRNISEKDLLHLGNKLRILIQNSYLPHGEDQLNVTISLGATLVTDDDTIDSLIKRADILLYESKKAGRNRLTLG
jgi:diguanylate cyclase (GGDEF)-like protein/PAS domain S-box-containing protein